MSAPAILARGLRRDFGGVAVLAGVDLTVEPGELLVLLGPNGAGKTTLLRVLATLLRPSGGTLQLFGEDAQQRRLAGAVRPQLHDQLARLDREIDAGEHGDATEVAPQAPSEDGGRAQSVLCPPMDGTSARSTQA